MSKPILPFALLQQYHYDAADRLIAVQPPGQSASRRFYAGTVLGNELGNEVRRTHLKLGGQLSGIRDQDNGSAKVLLFGTEQQGSVLQVLSDGGSQHLAYTAHGQGADLSLPGFNGEQPDPLTGNYLLGNGYRAYNPTLQRFHGPDSFSPFGGGGLNAYTYCLGDPVNRADPTGHMSWQAGVGMGLGIVGMLYGGHALVFGAIAMTSGVSAASVAVLASVAAGLGAMGAGIAQAVISQSDPSSAAAATLGWIALGLGAASAVAGLAANQFSPANDVKPLQVSSLGGKLSLGPSSRERWLAVRLAGQFGPFPSTSQHLGAMRVLTGMLDATDLTALVSTSTGMRNMVYDSLRPLNRIPTAHMSRDAIVVMTERIGAGQVLGQMPVQLFRAGITQSRLPRLPDSDSGTSGSPTLEQRERQARIASGVERQNLVRRRFARRSD